MGAAEDLKAALERGRVVVVAGAGTSAAMAGHGPWSSWRGLIEDGIRRAETATPRPPADWAKVMHAQLDWQDPDDLITVAQQVTARLGGSKDDQYRRWLEDLLKPVTPSDPRVGAALAALGAPIMTTNYDGLLELAAPDRFRGQGAGSSWTTWKDAERVRRVLMGDDDAVIHLHGFWQDPPSVVLGIRSYDEVLGDARAQAIQQALGVLSTLVFVGTGGTTDDPNLGRLMSWLLQTFGGATKHFRLCLEREVDALEADPHADVTVPVVYGTEHKDLPAFLEQLAAGRSTAGATPAVAPASTAPLLPAARPTIGRGGHVTEVISNSLADPPVPSLVVGPAGVGKTNLTLTAAHAPLVAQRFGNRRFFVRCEGAESAHDLWAEMARSLDLEPTGRGLEARVLGALQGSPTLLVLDNLETPWEADPLRVEEVLAQVSALPGLALVASIRGVSRPDGAAWGPSIEIQPLDMPERKQLFLAIAPARFDAPGLDALLEDLGGIPLAVQLLAHVAEGETTVEGLASRWTTGRTKVLTRSSGDTKDLSVAVSVEASWTSPELGPASRRLLSLLCQLPDGMPLADTEIYLPKDGATAAGILRRQALAFDEGNRLRTHPPIRFHIAAVHPPATEDFDRLKEHHIELARRALRLGWAGGAEAVTIVTPEIGNVVAVLSASVAMETRLPTDAVIGLARFVQRTGLGSVVPVELAAQAAEADGDILVQADCLCALADVAAARSDSEKAEGLYSAARDLFHAGEAPGREAVCIKSLGNLAFYRSEFPRAVQLYNDASERFREVGDTLGRANCTKNLAKIASLEGDGPRAIEIFDEAMVLYREVEDPIGEANCLVGLADLARRTDENETARRHIDAALPLFDAAGEALGKANCLHMSGSLALIESDLVVGRERTEEALKLYRQLGSELGVGNCYLLLATVELFDDELDVARELFQAAYAAYERSSSRFGMSNALRGLGDVAMDDGDRDGAVAHWTDALAIAQDLPDAETVKMLRDRLDTA